MKTDSPARSVVFLRCPEELRDQLAAAAKQSLRSVNSEVVYRLQESLKRQTTAEETAARPTVHGGSLAIFPMPIRETTT
jgi:hypothetical protein